MFKQSHYVALISILCMTILTVGIALATGITGGVIDLGAGNFILDNTGKYRWGGVIIVDLDGEQAGTFCTDLLHPIKVGDQIVATDQKIDCRINWLVHNYPPEIGPLLSNNEAAARQAAVWHFSDGFLPIKTGAVGRRAWKIIEEVNQLTNNGANIGAACADLNADPVSLQLTPAQIALKKGETAQFTVTAKQGSNLINGLSISLSSSFGNLNSTTVTTNGDGQAIFTVSADKTGVAEVIAQARYTLPASTIFEGADPERQKLVLGQNVEGDIFAKAVSTWQANGSLTVHLFHDRNMDEIQNNSTTEADLPNWEVVLKNKAGQVISTTTTDSNGQVQFNNLTNGDYTVAYTLLDDWFSTSPSETTQATVTINNDSHLVEFGVVQAPVIIAYKYHDLNGNRHKDDNEPFLADWEMALYRDGGDFVLGANAMTDSNGRVVLTFRRHSEFISGYYTVEEDLTGRTGWQATTPANQRIFLREGDKKELYFGNRYQQALGSITIVKEASRDRSFDFMGSLGEFTLHTGESQQFDDLPPGSYTIAEDPTSFASESWALLSVRCFNQQGQAVPVSVNWSDYKADITLASGQNLTCTYLNEEANLIDTPFQQTYLPIIQQ